jgi:hypothetical protein
LISFDALESLEHRGAECRRHVMSLPSGYRLRA